MLIESGYRVRSGPAGLRSVQHCSPSAPPCGPFALLPGRLRNVLQNLSRLPRSRCRALRNAVEHFEIRVLLGTTRKSRDWCGKIGRVLTFPDELRSQIDVVSLDL